MALITEKGVLTYKSEVETGTSKAGNPWAKQTIVVSREGVNAPYDKVALQVFGDKVNESNRLKVGDKVEVAYSISAREYNGKWYNDVSLFKIEAEVSGQKASTAPAPAPQTKNIPSSELEPKGGDLPF